MPDERYDDRDELPEDTPPADAGVPLERWREPERRQGDAEDYKPEVNPADELSDYERRTHGDTRRI